MDNPFQLVSRSNLATLIPKGEMVKLVGDRMAVISGRLHTQTSTQAATIYRQERESIMQAVDRIQESMMKRFHELQSENEERRQRMGKWKRSLKSRTDRCTGTQSMRNVRWIG